MRPFAPVDGEPAPLADTALAGGPCLYCQLDELAQSGGEDGGAGDEDEDDAGTSTRDLIITPSDPSAVERIFEAFSQCAALHPSDLSDDEDGPQFGGGGAWSGQIDENDEELRCVDVGDVRR